MTSAAAGSPAQPSPALRSTLDAFLAEQLNPAQRQAVTAPDGPLLILAGAGSGKTRVIAYRIAYLVRERGVLPEQILAVTFTNKAAGEMRERVEQLIGTAARRVVLGTFHRICARWLRREAHHAGYDPGFSIYDDDDQLALLKRCYADAGINPKQYAPPAVRAEISRAKEKLLTPLQFAQQAETPFELAVATLYRRYQEALQEQNALDFDDLLVLMVRIFEAAPPVLEQYQQRFRHVLVDEYQDVNLAQYLLVSKLAAAHRNITVVGDDSQAIYGWRGADVRYILQFEADFPEARVVRLEQNYRSTKTILAAAQAVEAGLRERHRKHLWTENPQGGPILLYHAADEYDEAMFVAREIDRLVSSEGCRYRDVAVLYRMNAQSRALEEALVKRRIPYQLVGGTRFYERREVKDLIAYLRLINNPADGVSLGRIVNVPPRGIGERTLDELRAWASQLGIPVAYALRRLQQGEDEREPPGEAGRVAAPFSGRARSQLLAFARLLDELATLSQQVGLLELFDQLIARTGYKEYLAADKAGEERWENVMELRSVVSHYAALEPGAGLRAFLEEVALMTDIDTLRDAVDAVTLLTLHAAKGLEFPAVFITGMEEGIFPHSRAETEPELDEERRLCYVGFTRAMQRLYLLWCERRTVFGLPRPSEPSRFLLDLPLERVQQVGGRGLAAAGLAAGLWPGGAVRAWSGTGTMLGRGREAGGGQPSRAPAPGTGTGTPLGYRREGASAAARPVSRRFEAPAPPGSREAPRTGLAGGPGAGSPAAQPEPRFRPGDRVRHTHFGTGVVLESTVTRRGEEEVLVRFDTAGIRLLLGTQAPMEVIRAGAAPGA